MADQNNKIATWPTKIWLQWNPDELEEYPGLSEDLTWCSHNIHESDVEYVRADLAAPAVPAVDALTRYAMSAGYMMERELGAYVKFADVQALLAAAPADPEQARMDGLAQAGLAAALGNHAAGGTDDAEDVFSQADVIDLLQHELIIDSGATFLRAGSSMSFDLEELTLFANHAVKVARQPQAAPEATSEQAESELRRAVKAMTSLLADREWAEHISRDKDAAALESEITRLVGAAAPADLSKLTRQDHRGALMVLDSTGDYFLVSEVRDLFEQHHGITGGGK